VTTAATLDLGALADSPYAQQLRRGVSHVRFDATLESEFRRARLLESRVLVRVACVFSMVLALLRGIDQVYEGTWNVVLLIGLAIVIVSSTALASVAWSSRYVSMYTPWARILVPARNMVVAAQIAAAAAHGQLEMLMVLPLALVGPFFFMGLRFRAALFCCVLTVLAYAISATVFELPLSVALRSYVFLLAGAIAYIVAAGHLERSFRLSFLEGRLITQLAQHDSLTGIKNRRVFDEHLQHVWQQAVDERCAVAILLIDIDHFKSYNDRYGHQAGDRTLRRVAQALQKFARESPDLLARYGGEEFAVVLYDADTRKAMNIAEQMLAAVALLNIEHCGSGANPRVTISVGVAAVAPSPNRSSHGFLQLADQALYDAKLRGRNRVALMDEGHHELLVTGVFAIDARHPAKVANSFE
jgi:diguanylate cyclase (GGDEF)-like protein